MIRHRLFLGSSSEGEAKAKWLKGLLLDIAKNTLNLEREEFVVVGWWEEGIFPVNATFVESLFDQLDKTDSAILIATEDDQVKRRGKEEHTPRDNIILEYGLWSGRHGRVNTAIATVGSPQLPSDLEGVNRLSLEKADKLTDFWTYNRPKTEVWLTDLLGPSPKLSGKVLVLFPSFKDDPFYYDLYVGITRTLLEGYGPALRFPKDAYDAEQFLMKLREISQHEDEYVGAIIRPVLVGPKADELRNIVADWDIPTVFVDINPFEKGKVKMPDHVCYVGFNNDQGGRLAARAMSRELMGRKAPMVLVVTSDEQPERRDAFCKELKALDPTAELKVVPCKFNRDEAYRCVQKAFKQLWRQNERYFDGIFCSSDVMAMGANTAVSDRFDDNQNKIRDIVIVGYDGTLQAKSMVDYSGSPVRNTVEQNPDPLGACAAGLLVKMMRRNKIQESERVQILPVELYVGNDNSVGS